MKLSVSVPDELWEKARRRVDDDSPSAVVQRALSRLAAQAATDYQVRPVSDDISAALEAARARVVAEAQEMFQTGYRQGLELAAELGYRQLELMVRLGGVMAASHMANWAHKRLIERDDDPMYQNEPIISPELLAEYYGSYADYLGDVDWTPSRPTTEGIDAALRDLWQRVTEAADLTGGEAEAADQQ